MKRLRVTLRFLLLASALTFSLTACGGSDSSPSAATTSTDKTASWTNVSIRAFDEKVNISWDKAAGSSQTTTGSALSAAMPTYNLYFSNVPTDIVQDKNRIAANYTGTSFDHTVLNNGQRYYYAVTEVTAAGEGPASLTVSATPQAVQPAAPYGLKVTALHDLVALTPTVKLEFMGPPPPSNVTVSYNLYRSTARNFTADSIPIELKIPITQLTPYTDKSSELKNGTIYYYAAKAVAAGKESGFSPVVSAQPQAIVAAVSPSTTPPVLATFASPTDMSAEPGNGSCIIRWTDVPALDKLTPDQDLNASATPDYILYWSDSPDVGTVDNIGILKNVIGKKIDNVTKDVASGGFKLTGLTNGITYYLQVVAAVRDINGLPPTEPLLRFTPGPVVSVTPALKTPTIPSGVSATQGPQQVLLTWSKDNSGIPGITYNIYFSTTDARDPAELMSNGVKKNNDDSTKAYFNHTGLQSGKTYYYVVTSVGEGESAPSSIVSVTL